MTRTEPVVVFSLLGAVLSTAFEYFAPGSWPAVSAAIGSLIAMSARAKVTPVG